jgi:hypothetical protein
MINVGAIYLFWILVVDLEFEEVEPLLEKIHIPEMF